MTYSSRVKSSFSGFWHNPSMLAVLLLEFIARTVMVAAFMILDGFLLYWINKDAFNLLQPTGTVNWQALANPPTIAVMGVVLLLELFFLLYVNSFFMSGFYGMVKNYVKDGSTTFNEFMPSVRRYWQAIFRFLFIRYLLLLIIMIPAGLAFLSYMGTPAELLATSQWVLLIVAASVAVLLGALIYLAFFYAEPTIVFEDASASEAISRSWRLFKENFGKTVLAGLGILALMIVAGLIVTLLLLPFDMIVKNTQFSSNADAWTTVRSVADWTFNIITISATIIAAIFTLLTYYEVVGGASESKKRSALALALAAQAKQNAKPIARKKPVKKR